MALDTVQTDIRGGTLVTERSVGLRLPGGTHEVVPIQGLEGILRTLGGFTQQVSDLTNEIKVMNSRQAQFYQGDPMSLNADRVIRDVMSGRQVSAGRADNLDPIHDGAPGAPPEGGGSLSTGTTDPVAASLETYKVGNIRQEVGKYAQRQLQNRTWGDQYSQDEGGMFDGMWRGPDGRFVSANDPGISDFAKRQTIMMAGRGAAQSLAETGSYRAAGSAALGSTAAGSVALKAAGFAGLAAAGVNKVGDFAEGQRAANAEWQSMMGGTNVGAYRERFNQQMFGMSQFGVLDSADAEKLYRDVAATGLRGEARDTAQNFAIENYKQFGMDIDSSMKIIKTASETGQSSLIGVSLALERVTDAAVEAGVSAEKMRNSWISTWQTMSQSVAGGTAATTATGFTESLAGLGPEYADLGFNPGEQQFALLAANAGMGLQEFTLATRQPGNEGMILSGTEKDLRRRLSSMISSQGVRAIVEAAGGRKSSEMDAGTKKGLGDLYSMAGGYQYNVLDVLLQSGVTGANPGNALNLAGMIVAGAWTPGQDAEDAIADAKAAGPRMFGGLTESEFSELNSVGQKPMGVFGSEGFAAVSNPLVDAELRELEEKTRASMPSGLGGFFNIDDKQVIRNFMSDVEKTGQRGGISELLATNATSRSSAMRVTIKDENGNDKTVDLQEAMSQYRSQLDDGSAVIAEGDSAGQTVGQAFSELQTGSTNITGTISINASPELKRFFSFGNFVDLEIFNGDEVSPESRPGG